MIPDDPTVYTTVNHGSAHHVVRIELGEVRKLEPTDSWFRDVIIISSHRSIEVRHSITMFANSAEALQLVT